MPPSPRGVPRTNGWPLRFACSARTSSAGTGLLRLFAGVLFLIGIIIDLIALLGKPNPHYI